MTNAIKTFLAALALAAVSAATHAQAGGFTPELFDAWIKMRAGDGKPVFWYSEGIVKSNPEGETIGYMTGTDMSIVMRDETKPNTWIQLSRKIFITIDPKTGEIALGPDGKPRRPIAYPYQMKTYTLDGDEIVYSVQSHDGRVIADEEPRRNYSVRKIGNVTHFNYAMFIDRDRGNGERVQRFEVNDFFMRPDPDLNEQERYQYTWTGTGPGPIMSSAVSWRYSAFDDIPNELVKKYIRENAPLWQAPPKDMAEIERIRTIRPYPLGQK
ncbi:MAG: hypothetical protein KDE14_05550 [Rhodobacteraceae bacterium]|nr:hypothetical protein [Paracoccaceae bacterium]